jgi:hypothetical protein
LDNFLNFFNYTDCDNLTDLKNALPKLRAEIKQDYHFKPMYKKLFDLYTGQHTTLDLDTAEALWGVYLKEKFKFYDQWMAYLNSLEEKQTKKVHKDLWFMVWDFCYEIQEIEKYSEDDGWPTFIDNFVEYVKNS